MTDAAICLRPFACFEIAHFSKPRGDVYFCCPSWLPEPIGNLLRQSVGEIWNGEAARRIRRSVLDGSYRHCRREACPFLASGQNAPEVSWLADREGVLPFAAEALSRGPLAVNCAFDRSCTLSCPSCRREVVVERPAGGEIHEILNRVRSEALRDALQVSLSGAGDPFGSPFFRRWLMTLRPGDHPQLERIHVHTNGTLWTPELWRLFPKEVRTLVRSTEISIDAATAGTYAFNRRGGRFDRLLGNLEFVAALRRNGPLRHVKVSMVVQENNFREMADFVRLARRFGFDEAYFSRLENWGTFSYPEYRARAVHLPGHARHADLLSVLGDGCFAAPDVSLGNLAGLVAPGAS